MRYPAAFLGPWIILLIATPGCAPKPTLPPYQSVPGNFQVETPGRPKVMTKMIKEAVGPLEQTEVDFKDDVTWTTHSVTYIDYPDSVFQGNDPASLLERAVENLTRSGDWAIRKSQPIRLGPHPGLDVWAEGKYSDGMVMINRCRYYLVGNRYYCVDAFGMESHAEEMDRYVASFHLLRDVPNLSPPSEAAAPAEPTSKDPESSPK